MKKNLALLLAITLTLFSFCLPVSAAATEQHQFSLSSSFVRSASVDVTQSPDGLIEITLTHQEDIPDTFVSAGVESHKTTTLSFLAESIEEKDCILQRINQVRASNLEIFNDDWFFGSSCYIYISVIYSTRSVWNGTEARINSVTTRHSVNSGTSVSNAVLHLACIGYSSDSGGQYLEEDITVTRTPYTNTLMNTWPWINTGGPCLGANYTVTARRPSGSSSTHTVAATVFVN